MNTILNISIPTYNRPDFLYRCIKSIQTSIYQLNEDDRHLISVYVSDNSDNINSKQVTELSEFDSITINYIQNEFNIGSDNNIAQCYLYPHSEYVMILGDDDFLSVNFLTCALPFLKDKSYPILFFKAYGLTKNESQLRSDRLKGVYEYKSFSEALMCRNIHLAFISNMAFRRSDYSEDIVKDGVGTNLVQFNLVLHLLKEFKGKSISLNANLVMSTRNNTGGYDPLEIFGNNFFALIEKYLGNDNQSFDLFALKKRVLHTFYNRSLAQYKLKAGDGLVKNNLGIFDIWYRKYLFYNVFYRPLFLWNSKMSYYILSLAYVFGNFYYNPRTKIGDFLYHFITHFRLKLNTISK
jgi:abequosyltransferase